MKDQNWFINIDIEINHGCNLSCDYCPNSVATRKEQGFMSMDLFEKILLQLQDIHFKGRICYHFYNEPLLHPQLEEFVALSKKLLPQSRSEIYSNGMHLNEEKYKRLRLAGVDKFTITKHQGIKNLVFEDVYSKLSLNERKTIDYADYSTLLYSNRGGKVDYGRSMTDTVKKRPCLIPIFNPVVTVKGNILTCYEDFDQTHAMGNINDQHIKDIWLSENYVNFRNDLKSGMREKHPVCRDCNNIQVIS